MANPAISVVVPLYNAEKYLAESLDSILAQTFKDFEVILVNDCSTDKSRQIAESYLKKFGGRLKIFDNEENSGAGDTRSNGLRNATGEYIFFMDADDLITETALEEMYRVAKSFDVDIVNMTGFYNMNEDGKDRKLVHLKKPYDIKEPVVESNLEWRVQGLLSDNFYWAPWRKFLRREFLIRNRLFFPDKLRRTEDVVWTHGLWLYAKKIAHVPLAVYLYRQTPDSVARTRRPPLENVNSRIDNVIHAVKWIDKMMKGSRFFKENPQYYYPMLEHVAQRFLVRVFQSSLKVSSAAIYKSVNQELGKSFGKYDVLIPLIFTVASDLQKTILKKDKRIAELEEQLKAKQGKSNDK